MDTALLIDTIRTVAVILGSLTVGYGLRKSGRVAEATGTSINRIALTFVQPLVICVALWSMAPPDWHTLALPLYGLCLIVLMWPVGAVVSRLLPMDRPSRGSFVTCSMFSNVGFTYGTFIAYVLLGPEGAALGALYCVSFSPAFFTLGFFVSGRYGSSAQRSIGGALLQLLRDAHTRHPLMGILLGLMLNLLRVPAPAASGFFIDVAMPLTTAAFVTAIGMQLRLSAVREYWRECVLTHVTKFAVSPLLGLGLAFLFGYTQMQDHSLLKVAFIQSSTPVAIMCVLLADIFDLNRRLAGALWLTTNLTAALLAPLVLIVARML
ncbi:MAG TPA: hypothetical protein DGT21_19455 [Armatimonadetes bacterium]|nr:hypothetical protein [Armatimonadota bacterium]